ncbi:hypothetical protein OOU_Y34scaffold00765g98 [Pyricularia oryzae Y34]|uniref:Gylcosyl hydrolase 115 C-terminal domain-containing protein n=2 Tax=Pyricularia oryzae TaxID=318829 RepID=A0AA97PHB0_PYRO3|nr:hypothetical protein OOU_Y34scaffold00765g98 [Pyricularia oryzae Y34]
MASNDLVTFAGDGPAELVDLAQATIFIHADDFPGVHIAARNLAQDFARVTGSDPRPIVLLKGNADSTDIEKVDNGIIIGSLQRNPLLQSLKGYELASLDTGRVLGKWESFTTAVLQKPFPWCKRALAIAGSDKRGAIFGTYTLSEQIGVSPWYYWADVPPKHRASIHALPVNTYQGEPSVKYRGIFINDEAPALTGWVLENFGSYGPEFYKKVYELLLRLKANFMWPAMWPGYPNPGAIFFTDDAENARIADEYGIAVSTSHHEPMQRATSEWFADNPDGSWNWLTNREKITDFFREGASRAKGLESYFTLGMRGEYDKGMKADDPAAVVRDVLKTQRGIFKDVYGREDAVPQLLALYKEVQEQYDSGRLEVPDDVTLLFADDNFGTIRRLPTGDEVKRSGGAGGKTWHQLREAHRRKANRIWVFNVGDIKPIEVPLTFAMKLAWNINSVKPDDFQTAFYKSTAESYFSDYLLAYDIGANWQAYDRLASLRRHEHIEASTFSLLHYNEASEIVKRWKNLLTDAEKIYAQCSEAEKPAVFELVLHPAKASYIFTQLQITLARNQMFARQRRNTTNSVARRVLKLFDADFDLSEEFHHSLLQGKWNHIMCQAHMGYGDTWHAPSRDMISGLCYVQTRQNSNAIVGQMGVAIEGHEGVRPGRINEESERTHPSRRDLVPGLTLSPMSRYGPASRWFDIFTRGTQVIHWKASSPHSWITLSQTTGTLNPKSEDPDEDAHVEISINWDEVPDDFRSEVLVDIRSEEGDFEQVHLPVDGRRLPSSYSDGFVEAEGIISIPAPCVQGPLPSGYKVLPEIGRGLEGSVAQLEALDADSMLVQCLQYKTYVFTDLIAADTNVAVLALYFNMTLDIDPTNPMSFKFQVDDGQTHTHTLLPSQDQKGQSGNGLPDGWFHAVQDCVWLRKYTINAATLTPGEHTIRLWLAHSNLVLEKIVIDFGGMKPSYLGPPASMYID